MWDVMRYVGRIRGPGAGPGGWTHPLPPPLGGALGASAGTHFQVRTITFIYSVIDVGHCNVFKMSCEWTMLSLSKHYRR